MENKVKEAIIPLCVVVLLTIGGMALLFGWMGCAGGSLPAMSGADYAQMQSSGDITPMTVSGATGGAVSEAEIQAEAELVQAAHPDWPWAAVLLSVASTLTYRKAAPHVPIIGAAASAMARANPLIALIGSIIHSTTEINRANAKKPS